MVDKTQLTEFLTKVSIEEKFRAQYKEFINEVKEFDRQVEEESSRAIQAIRNVLRYTMSKNFHATIKATVSFKTTDIPVLVLLIGASFEQPFLADRKGRCYVL